MCGNALFDESSVEVTLHRGRNEQPRPIELPYELATEDGHCRLSTESGEYADAESTESAEAFPESRERLSWRTVEPSCTAGGTEVVQVLDCKGTGGGELRVCDEGGSDCQRFVVHCRDY